MVADTAYHSAPGWNLPFDEAGLWPGRTDSHNNNNNNIHICIAPYGRNFRGAGESDMNHPVNLIWAVCGEYAPHSTVLTINHFVPLIALPIEGNTDDRQGQARAADMDESVEDGDAQDVSQESETPLPVATGQTLTREFMSLHACVLVSRS